VTESTNGVANVPDRGIYPACHVHIARPFTLDNWIAESQSRQAACLAGTGAFALEIVGALGEMKRDLAINSAVDLFRPE
jgi:hypothetical protein